MNPECEQMPNKIVNAGGIALGIALADMARYQSGTPVPSREVVP